MNQLLLWLSVGDQRTDGLSNRVVDIVLGNPQAIDDLFEGLNAKEDALRDHVADALEKIGRQHPELFLERFDQLVQLAKQDPSLTVRFHLVMLLGHLACFENKVDEVTSLLLDALADQSAFVRSWAIASLCAIGRAYPEKSQQILDTLAALRDDPSVAVSTRKRKTLRVLMNPEVRIPQGWVKGEHLSKKIGDRNGD